MWPHAVEPHRRGLCAESNTRREGHSASKPRRAVGHVEETEDGFRG